MSLYGSLLSPELNPHPPAPNSFNSFVFKTFGTLFTLPAPRISRNSSGINRLRTLAKKIGEWGRVRRFRRADIQTPTGRGGCRRFGLSCVFINLQIPHAKLSICMPFVLRSLQIPLPASLLFSHRYKTPRVPTSCFADPVLVQPYLAALSRFCIRSSIVAGPKPALHSLFIEEALL